MGVSFDSLKIGQEYDRPYLAREWGYTNHSVISRGVFTPAKTKYILIFVTKEKQKAFTQYNDYLDGNLLHWEGETKHGSDDRIINASKNNEEIHLFYRAKHHTSFIYYGEIALKEYRVHDDVPSQFIFVVGKQPWGGVDLLDDIESSKDDFIKLNKTEQNSIVKSRIGQGVFRERLIARWRGCAVTGLSNISLLKASHIKPWRVCNNQERLDIDNGLLLNPVLDHLFDVGYITFSDFGNINISAELSAVDMGILNINQDMCLRDVPDKVKQYLKYHRNNIFRKNNSIK